MRSLVLEDARRLAWHDVPEPQRRHEREAIVRPLAVATCDLDQPMVFGRLCSGLRLGHECVAEVVDLLQGRRGPSGSYRARAIAARRGSANIRPAPSFGASASRDPTRPLDGDRALRTTGLV